MDQQIPVLLVDRSRLSRRLVTMSLEKLGLYIVLTADDPNQAWDVLNTRHDLSLVITAMMLPSHQDGLNLVRSIRQHYTPRKLPILMLSSNNDKDMVENAIQAGVNDFLFKPVFPDVLEERLQRLLNSPASVHTSTGDHLVNRGLITDEQRNTALRYQRMYSSEHIHISVLARYLGYIEEDMLNRLFLEDAVEEDVFMQRAHTLGVTPSRLAHLAELKKQNKLRIGDILVKLRFIRREVLESAMRSFYKS